MLAPAAIAELYRRELLDQVLPFWLRHSLDPEFGGSFSCLDRDGSLYDDRKYVWMMGRQVWMLAKLYRELEPRPEWLAAARQGVEFLDRFALRADGQVWFSLARDGQPLYCQRKPYSAVFLALAWNEYGRATGDTARQQRARELFGRIRHWIRHPEELGRPASSMSQLADIYVTAFLADELGEPEHLPACFAALDAHFDGPLMRENAGIPDSPEARLFCPGSVFEVSWILMRQTADPARLLSAIEAAHQRGLDREFGGYYYFLDLAGKPPLQLEWNMKLWWVHVEALVAFAHAWQRTGDARWLALFQQTHDWVWPRFRDPAFGEWFGYLDRRGEPTHLLKGGPYKCCFHVPRALWLISRIFSSAPAA